MLLRRRRRGRRYHHHRHHYCSFSYGLKSWEETPIDIVEDDGCSSMPTVEGFFSLRSPDAIKLVTVGEDIYIITANEVS